MPTYVGIDWSENKHDVLFLNEKQARVAQLTIPHSPEGFLKLDTTRQALASRQSADAPDARQGESDDLFDPSSGSIVQPTASCIAAVLSSRLGAVQ